MYTPTRAAIALSVLLSVIIAPVSVAFVTSSPDEQLDTQPEAPALPDAESLFEAYITAIGGQDALAKHRNLVMHASYRVLASDDIQILTISLEAPNKLYAELEAPALGTTVQATNGTLVWGINMTGSTYEITGREKDEMLDSSFFQGEASYKKHYSSIQTTGTAMIDHKPAIRVDFVTFSGLEGAVYFDPDTHLVSARQIFPADTSDTSVLVTVSDYKEFEGVLIPTVQHQRVGEANEPVVEIEFKWIEVNVDDMPDFDPPADKPLSSGS